MITTRGASEFIQRKQRPTWSSRVAIARPELYLQSPAMTWPSLLKGLISALELQSWSGYNYARLTRVYTIYHMPYTLYHVVYPYSIYHISTRYKYPVHLSRANAWREVVDIATLTGACMVALGQGITGLGPMQFLRKFT